VIPNLALSLPPYTKEIMQQSAGLRMLQTLRVLQQQMLRVALLIDRMEPNK
jgi:hypothetical protein